MTVVTIEEAKDRIEELAVLASSGEKVRITRGEMPAVELKAAAIPVAGKRVFGAWAGKFELKDDFLSPCRTSGLMPFTTVQFFQRTKTRTARAPSPANVFRLPSRHSYLPLVQAGDPRFPPKLRRLVEEETRIVYLSAVTCWEITTKYQLGKLSIAADVANDIEAEATKCGMSTLPITFAHASAQALCRTSIKIRLTGC